MVTLSITNYYTTSPIVLVNGTRQYYDFSFTTGDEVEIKFKKLAGLTYTEAFTLAGEPLTITGLDEGETADGYHYLKFTGDAAWDSKTLAFSVDVTDKSSFKTVTASGTYDGVSAMTSAYVTVDGTNYPIYTGLAPVGATVEIQAGLNQISTGAVFDKLNASTVGLTDADIIKQQWTYGYFNSKYNATLYVDFVMPNNDVTAVLDFKAATMTTVTFYVDGSQYQQSSYVPVGGLLGEAKNNNLLTRTPYKQGYTFDGWYVDDEFTTEATTSTVIPADGLNLYAKFTAIVTTHTVTFNSNGGSEVPSQEVDDGEKATKPEDPTKTGAEFVDWYSDETLETVYDFDTVVTADIVLYAGWNNLQNTVTFKEGDETIATVKVDDKERVKPIEPLHSTDASGNEFVYWALNNVEYDFTTPVDNDITLVAVYAKAASSKWIMSLPNCFVGLKSDVADLPKARVANGTKALAISANEGEETAYIFHRASLTWVELQHYTVNI